MVSFDNKNDNCSNANGNGKANGNAVHIDSAGLKPGANGDGGRIASASHLDRAAVLAESWRRDDRWWCVSRPYDAEDVCRLRGSIKVEHTLATLGARRLWQLLADEPYIAALGALTGNQAIQQVRAGLKAIYVSGWQVAADSNGAGQMYPDQSLYPCDSVPHLVRRINNALLRADQIHCGQGDHAT